VVEFGDAIDVAVNNQVRALALTLEAARIPGLLALVPTYRSLGVQYDPVLLASEELRSRIEGALASLDPGQLPSPRWCASRRATEASSAPDLSFVAEHTKLSESEVIGCTARLPTTST